MRWRRRIRSWAWSRTTIRHPQKRRNHRSSRQVQQRRVSSAPRPRRPHWPCRCSRHRSRRRRLRLNDLILGMHELRLQSGDAATDVRELSLDSRKLAPGALFAALPGAKLDGRSFIPAAVKGGAVAILAPEGGKLPELPSGVALLT